MRLASNSVAGMVTNRATRGSGDAYTSGTASLTPGPREATQGKPDGYGDDQPTSSTDVLWEPTTVAVILRVKPIDRSTAEFRRRRWIDVTST